MQLQTHLVRGRRSRALRYRPTLMNTKGTEVSFPPDSLNATRNELLLTPSSVRCTKARTKISLNRDEWVIVTIWTGRFKGLKNERKTHDICQCHRATVPITPHPRAAPELIGKLIGHVSNSTRPLVRSHCNRANRRNLERKPQ